MNGVCVGGISILGAYILHMQAGPAYACIPYLTHNEPVQYTRYNYSSATYLTFFFFHFVDTLMSD